jgi:hypothetical protein
MELREIAVNGAIENLKEMKKELQSKLYTVATIEETLDIAEELEDVNAALEDAILHKDHYIKYGVIYQ